MTHRTTVDRFADRVERSGDRIAMRQLAASGETSAMTWREWSDRAGHLAAMLIDRGHGAGERAAIFAGNRLIWPVAEMGIHAAGLVSVGLYPSSAPAQVGRILSDCGATVAIVDTAERLDTLRSVLPSVPTLRTVIAEQGPAGGGVLAWSDALDMGRRLLDAIDGMSDALAARRAAVTPDTLAALIYTSGSTGDPKGARIPHRYIDASTASIRDTLALTDRDTTISFLPYSHAGERVFGLHTRVRCGMETLLLEDHARLWSATREYAPTLFGGMPRFFEKAYEALEAERARLGGPDRERWERALELGRERSRARRRGAPVPDELEREWCVAAAPVLEHLRALFGGRLRLATSGGATLPAYVAESLDACGVTVLGAYGMTEQLCVAFFRPDRYAFEGVGPPMPGADIRIAADGEVLVRRCALTFDGYHGLPAESRAAFTEDGDWLRTGDLGSCDDAGVLRISGRKKELIALSTGKKVAPLPIEARLAAEPWIAQAMLYGEGKKFVTALVALRQPVIEAWARSRRLDLPYADLLRHPDVLAELTRAIERVNASLSRTEQVRRFAVLEQELSAEAEELTPTLKIRRALVSARYGARLDALYD